MKIILNENFQIINVEDSLDETLVRGSNDFDVLAVYLPISKKESYTTIFPSYIIKRADGRVIGPYATLTTPDDSMSGYYGWKGHFNARDLSVNGSLQITIAFTLNGTVRKTVCKVTGNVTDAVELGDDVLILGDGGVVESFLTDIATFENALSQKADRDNANQTVTIGTLKVTSIENIDDEVILIDNEYQNNHSFAKVANNKVELETSSNETGTPTSNVKITKDSVSVEVANGNDSKKIEVKKDGVYVDDERVTLDAKKHDLLEHLDYDSSGHTGFMPQRLSILPTVASSVPNDRLVVAVHDTQTQSANKISIPNLADRIIKTAGTELPSNMNVGQYVFLEIDNE